MKINKINEDSNYSDNDFDREAPEAEEVPINSKIPVVRRNDGLPLKQDTNAIEKSLKSPSIQKNQVIISKKYSLELPTKEEHYSTPNIHLLK